MGTGSDRVDLVNDAITASLLSPNLRMSQALAIVQRTQIHMPVLLLYSRVEAEH